MNIADTPSPPLSRVTRLRHTLGLDGAVSFAVLGRAWLLLFSPLTFYLLVTRLTDVERGFYGNFSALVNLQVFLELGFSQSIVQFTSHEFARLRLLPSGALEGDPAALSRLISVGRLAIGYYCGMALIFVVAVGGIGSWFFSTAPDSAKVEWVRAWWLLCVFAGCNLAFLPFVCLLEGCNQVVFVNGCRMAAMVSSGIFLWGALVARAHLFAAAISSGGMFLATLVVVFWRWWRFFRVFRSPPPGPVVSWSREIWPFQWKIACSAVSGYLIFQLFNPVILQLKGAVEAGRMYLALQLINALTQVSNSWVATKAPQYGILISSGRFQELDRLSRRSILQSLIVCLAGSGALLVALELLHHYTPWGGKILGYDSFCWLIVAALTTQVLFGQAIYLRAHKQEPFLFLSVVNALLTATAVLMGASRNGSLGACAGYALVQLLILPFATAVFFRCRHLWHSSTSIRP